MNVPSLRSGKGVFFTHRRPLSHTRAIRSQLYPTPTEPQSCQDNGTKQQHSSLSAWVQLKRALAHDVELDLFQRLCLSHSAPEDPHFSVARKKFSVALRSAVGGETAGALSPQPVIVRLSCRPSQRPPGSSCAACPAVRVLDVELAVNRDS